MCDYCVEILNDLKAASKAAAANEEAKQAKDAPMETGLVLYSGLGRSIEGAADSQADGFAESAAEASSPGEASSAAKASPSWDPYRTSDEPVDPSGDCPYWTQEPSYQTPAEDEYDAVHGLARQLLEAPPSPESFAPVELDADEAEVGQVQAIGDLFRALAETIKFVVPISRSRSVALTKLDEASMWVNRGITRGE
jgi:hypothetical protein